MCAYQFGKEYTFFQLVDDDLYQLDTIGGHKISEQVVGEGAAGLHTLQRNSYSLCLEPAYNYRQAAQATYFTKHYRIRMGLCYAMR